MTRLGATRPVEIDIRYVVATNRDLSMEVEAGRFRRDLFFRLDGITLTIPPLRERLQQIGPLALRFLADAQARSGRGPGTAHLPTETLAALEAYSWPGNVRELKAVIERALLLSRGGDLLVEHLVFATRASAAEAPVAVASPPADLPEPTSDLTDGERDDRRAIIRALDECAGNQTRAAKLLGVSRTTLVNKMRLYRIPRPRG